MSLNQYRRMLTHAAFALLAITGAAKTAAADDLCDAAFQNCRTPLLALINAEQVRIDVSFWFMEDQRYSAAIINRWKAGVPVRIMMDSRANPDHPANATILGLFRDAGIPMREKFTGGILHRKFMLFAGQNKLEYSGANFSPDAFVPTTAYVNYVDEAIDFTDEATIVNSFKTMFEDMWTSTSGYRDYANVTTALVRVYPIYTKDPRLNFPPGQDYANRAVARYKAETPANAGKIDVQMYRITDRRHSDAMIDAFVNRKIPVRIYSDTFEYRNVARLWHAWNLDRMWLAGIPIKVPAHDGINHQKTVLLYGQGMTIFGSSNWTGASANSQAENNIFTTDSAFFMWFRDQFDRKWNNTNPSGVDETKPFVPQPPTTPVNKTPANAATGVATTGQKLMWYGGPWAHIYDVYFGTTSNPPRLAQNVDSVTCTGSNGCKAGPSLTTSDNQYFTLPALQPGTTYYWKIVSKTAAMLEKAGPVWSFTTAGGAPPPPPPPSSLPSGWTTADVGSVGAGGSANENSGTFTLVGSGADIWGTADAFRFAYVQLPGDGAITARVATVQNVNAWTKAGVMIRQSTSAGAAHGSVFVTPGKGVAYQRRLASGGASLNTQVAGTAPKWVKVARSSGTLIASMSSDGTTWTEVGRDSVSLTGTVLAGLVITSHDNTTTASATFDNVTISGGGIPPPPPPALPSGWTTADIGSVGAAGSASESNGTFTVSGSGADIWGSADAFRYAYVALPGDGSIVARVATMQNVNVWTKAGVMIRQSTSSGSAHASMFVTPGKGLAYQRRLTTGAASLNTQIAGTAPRWMRVTRAGQTITASVSSDGSSWSAVGTDTVSLSGGVWVGLAVTSHDSSRAATATFDHVSIVGG